MKFVANNTDRVIYGHYKINDLVESVPFRPGINRVPVEVLAALLQQSGFRELVDRGQLSKSPGDISAGLDVERAVAAGEPSLYAPPPIAPPNSRRGGLRLTPDQSSAIQAAEEAAKQFMQEGEQAHG